MGQDLDTDSLSLSQLKRHFERMGQHRFKDEDGRVWSAWDVHMGEKAALFPQLRGGWVAFESGDEKRRLAPIPSDFEKATDSMLRRWCHEAETVKRPPKRLS